ncbi:MAG: GerAB/ArcD/ProY family transporter [Oscillospiraceae bacterium]|nr:GerAB/ArcD/ProY family transporter [Oscillospiraceae bacterium]
MLSRIMHVMLYKANTFTSGTPLMLGLLISTAIEALLAVPVFIFLLKREEILQTVLKNERLKTVLKALLALYFIFVSGITLYLFAEFMHSEFALIALPWLIIVALAAAGAYCAHLGIEGIARAGTAVFWVFIALMVLMAVVNQGRYDPLNLIPVRKSDLKMMWDYVVWDISSCRWLPLTLGLVSYLKQGAQKAAIGYLVTKFVLIEGVLLLITMILWTFVDVPGYPILALGVYAKTDIIRQFNAINMFVWALNCVLVNGVYLNIASASFKKKNWLSVLVPAALAAAFAILCYKQIIHLTTDVQNLIMLVGIVLLGVLVPLAAIIYWRVKVKCEKLRQSFYRQ